MKVRGPDGEIRAWDTAAAALGIGPGSFVSVVGAGGKTTLLEHLARELAGQGLRVLVSSTTNLQPPRSKQPGNYILDNGEGGLSAALRARFARHARITVAGTGLRSDKVKGLDPDVLEAVFAARVADVIMVQADGARKRSFKAPAEHEPVVPCCSTHVILVAGLDALGEPLSERKVHRPEIVARLAGQSLESPVTVETMARVVGHPEGYLGRLPFSARRILYLSKADTPERDEAARRLAARVPVEQFPTVAWGDLVV
ncbi:MAG: putative selenium-dependent hydroxylase accessory protein YqeC [Planctomycetes bacterium]|nr:putative selenium-dependent hydroxylase accessory protein YqeC [Planctomycetota bacterium]